MFQKFPILVFQQRLTKKLVHQLQLALKMLLLPFVSLLKKLKLVVTDSNIKENKIILISLGLINVACSAGQNDK